MKNIMLDLETLGTRPNSVIVAVGAVEFDEDLGIISRFYETVDIQSCLDKGLEITGATISWWLKQSEEARRDICKDNLPLKDVLKKFQEWLGKGNLQMWGNGSAFDNVILKNAYHKFKAEPPWAYWSDRCYLTIRSSFSKMALERKGTHHNAVDDAEFQANYLIKLVQTHKLKGVL